MKSFNVYTGDGNFGTSFDHVIEAEDLDKAVAIYMEGMTPEARQEIDDEDGDKDHAILIVYAVTDDEGNEMRAYNGGAYFVAEIRDASNDPRCGRY